MLGESGGWSRDFGELDFWVLAGLSLKEAEEGGLEVIIVDVGLSEDAAVSLDLLGLLLLKHVQLDASNNGLSTIRTGDSEKGGPFLIYLNSVSDDLDIGFGDGSLSVNNLLFSILGENIKVVDGSGGNKGDLVITDPLPVADSFSESDILEFFLLIHIVDLNNVSASRLRLGLEGNDILGWMLKSRISSIGFSLEILSGQFIDTQLRL